MKKDKAMFIVILVTAMLVTIMLFLFLMKIGIWKIFIGAFTVFGIYLFCTKFYQWIIDDGPLDCAEIDTEDSLEEIPME